MEAPRPVAPNQGSAPNKQDVKHHQEKQLSHFARVFGVKLNAQPSRSELLSCFATSVKDHEVVLAIPSMDLKIDEDASDSSDNPLPRVGESNSSVISMDESESAAPSRADASSSCKPDMAASVLSSTYREESPSECKSLETIGKPISWTKSTVAYAAANAATNVSESFSSLIDSRLRSWTLLLLKHSLSTGESASRSRLMGILSTKVSGVSTEASFKTLPLPQSAAVHAEETRTVLPLLFEACIYLTLDGKKESVTLRAPGTISGEFLPGSAANHKTNLSNVEIRLDSAILLKAMVDQARLIVFKAVALATKTPLPQADKPTAMDTSDTVTDESQASDNVEKLPNGSPMARALSLTGLASCRSALHLPPKPNPNAAQSTLLLGKARSSALRLNSVLEGKVSRTRSVTFARSSEDSFSSRKRARVATANKLKSFKSFGRPHASDFEGGPRNATFGEYGGRAVWGRDGRMAHHPAPMQEMAGDEFANVPKPGGNAVFDLGSSNPLNRNLGPSPDATRLPRTATALENWFLKSTR